MALAQVDVLTTLLKAHTHTILPPIPQIENRGLFEVLYPPKKEDQEAYTKFLRYPLSWTEELFMSWTQFLMEVH